MSIRLLDEVTISKIAAGEIIENPASIVKELLENSIDANSKNIVIEIKGPIGEYIRITDDGDGIKTDELDLAFLRHSTSKLMKVEDLYNIVSLGFRGEALASISHISKVEIMTKSKDENVGTRAIVENGKIISKNNVGLPVGTTFFIKDVFYNTPVRKKYLKNDTTEFNYIQEVVQKISLAKENIAIKLIRDGKTIINTNRDSDLKNHIYNLLGREIASNLIETDFKSESYKIKAFFSNNNLYRSNRYHQYVYINGRYVKNLELSKKIEKSYYSLIPLNRYPVFILYIEIDPILVDVNIHPKKHEVKLSKENNLLAIIGEMLEDVLYPNRSIQNPLSDIKEDNKENVTVFEIFSDNKKDEIITETNFIEDRYIYSSSNDNNKDIKDILVKESEDFLNIESSASELSNSNKKDEIITEDLEPVKNETTSSINKELLNTKVIGTLFKTFIILENTNTGQCYLIDQHAAHERIMYEKFKLQYENSKIDSQILLKPEILDLNSAEKNNIENNLELFKSLGFELESFGERSILIRAVPVLFGLPSYVNFIYESIAALDKGIKSSYEIDPYKIMRKACRAAVKAGDILSDSEIEALINSLIKCDNPYTCPHGRPTILEFTKYDLEKLFLREV